jgi:hypothetical protein
MEPFGPFPHDAPYAPWFEEVTERTGIVAAHRALLSDPVFRGSGLAAGDLDGDDRIDIVVAPGEGGAKLFLNKGGLRFEDASDASGLGGVWARSPAIADLDGDGDDDIVLAGPDGVRIHINRGDATFVDVTEPHLAAAMDDQSVLLVDFDADGRIDILVAEGAVDGGPRGHLLRNLGEGRFANVWDDVGFARGVSWVATAVDYDHDGDIDIAFGNDTFRPDHGERPLPAIEREGETPDLLYRNDGAGSSGLPVFSEVGEAVGLREHRSTMGIVAGDFTGDGVTDLYFSDWGRNDLLVGRGDGTFDDRTEEYGVGMPRRDDRECDCLLVTWAAALADFDGDGVADLIAVHSTFPGGDTRQPAVVWRGLAAGGFAPVHTDLGWTSARAMVPADLDGDGDLDLVITTYDGPVRVFENVVGSQNQWLRVRLRGRRGNPNGLGATLVVTLEDGTRVHRGIGRGGIVHSWLPNEAAFGLGTSSVVSLEIDWPGGAHQTLAPVPANRLLTIDEPGE